MPDWPNQNPGHPRWTKVKRLWNADLAPSARLWLLDESSLTERLTSMAGGQFQVKRLSQRWQYPQPNEARLLQLPPRQQALIRETELLCAGQVMVFARSVFPYQSLAGSLGHLRKLQHQSLGALLFKHATMQRTAFEVAKIAGNSPYLPTHLQQHQTAWARRSRFIIEHKSLLVSEVFLHSFSPWLTQRSPQRSARGKIALRSRG